MAICDNNGSVNFNIDDDGYDHILTHVYNNSSYTIESHDPYYCMRCGEHTEYGERHRIACTSNESMLLGIFIAPTPETLANSALLRTRGWERLWRYPKVVESLAQLGVAGSSLFERVSLMIQPYSHSQYRLPLSHQLIFTSGSTSVSVIGSSLNLSTPNITLTDMTT